MSISVNGRSRKNNFESEELLVTDCIEVIQ